MSILEVELIGHVYELKWEVRREMSKFTPSFTTTTKTNKQKATMGRKAIYQDGKYWRSNNKN